MTKPDKHFLTSKKDIMEFLGIERAVFTHFLKINLPVVVINGRYYAHPENLDAWMKALTSKQRQEITVEEPPEE